MQAGITRALLLTTVATGAAAQTSKVPFDHPLGPPVNRWGAPVVDAEGVPMNYTQAQTDAQRQAVAGRPDPQAPLLGGCESTGALGAWKYFAFGTGIGESEFAASQVDGVTELIVGAGGFGFGGNRYWFVLRHDAQSGDYRQVFVSPIEPDAGVRQIAALDAYGDGGPEIFVLTTQDELQVWDQRTREQVDSLALGAVVSSMTFADVDADGAVELVYCSASHLRVRSLDGTLEWELAGVGGQDVVVAQMDADAALEIATTDGKVVDAESREVQWSWPDGFGFTMEAADIDDDGMAELVGSQAWSWIWAFDVDTQLPKWSLPVFNIGAIALTDIDDDGVQELIVGEAQWGEQLAYDTITLQQEWSINNPEHGTTDVAYGDVDGDGELEIIWGSGHSSTGEDHMFVADWATQAHEWSNVHLDGPFRGAVRGDVDGDGQPEVVSLTNESDAGYGAGRILVFDGQTLDLRAISQDVANGLGWSGTHEVKLRDIDGDVALEIVVATSTTYDGTIEIYDYDGGQTFIKSWQVPAPLPDGAFRSADVLDLDGDGELEVVGGCGGHVFVYDLASAAQEWQSFFISSYVSGLVVADTDDQPGYEVLALSNEGDLYVFDGETHAAEAILQGSYTAIRTTAVAVRPDLVLLTDSSGGLTTIQHQAGAYEVLSTIPLAGEAIDGFSLAGGGSLMVGAGGNLQLYHMPGGELGWQSCQYGDDFGTHTAFGYQYAVTGGIYGLVGFMRH